jgi:hypothetical protein
VSGFNAGLYVGTSAYQNFPKVQVSANLDKTNYTVSSGTINPVIVSAYQNMPQVQVSGINNSVINQIQNGLASASSNANIQTTVNAISAKTSQLTFSGTLVNANAVGLSFSGVTISASVDPTDVVNAILDAVIDTQKFSDIMTILLSNAVGNVDRNGYVFTYKKQDGTAIAFQNTMTSLSRRRTD